MKHIFSTILFSFVVSFMYAQQEFHVFPKEHELTPGTSVGNGSLQNPWDLQTALNQKPEVVNGDDIIWLHDGVYHGRFTSYLKSTIEGRFITVSSFKNEWAILNGNVVSTEASTLNVKGNNVIYRDFEISPKGQLSRRQNEMYYKVFGGVNHTVGGENCKFINLIIHGNPGLGFGSWRQTGGSLITNCLIFNNGVIDKNGKGRGEGMYVQNSSDEERIIEHNIIFNNYYKGIEIWSAGRNSEFEYVKNITLNNNVIFNSGLPSNYKTVDNIIVATDDRNGINIAKNITLKNNILYHNTNVLKNEINGDAASLTIGYYRKTPVENVVVDNNIIIGRNNAIRILYAKSLTFTNNVLYSGYVNLNATMFDYLNPTSWNFDHNRYYTKKRKVFRLDKETSFDFESWKSKFNMDANSEWTGHKNFNLDNVLDITKNEYTPNRYRVVLFNKEGKNINVDFSKYNIKAGMSYTIKDVEDYSNTLVNSIVSQNLQIMFPMSQTSNVPYKTLNNFGVYIIEFENEEEQIAEEKKDNFFKRFFKWLF